MSIRLHYATVCKLEWSGEAGMPFYAEELMRLFADLGVTVYRDEWDDAPTRFDIPKPALRDCVARLREDVRREIGPFQTEDLIAFLSDALEHAEPGLEEVRFEWF